MLTCSAAGKLIHIDTQAAIIVIVVVVLGYFFFPILIKMQLIRLVDLAAL